MTITDPVMQQLQISIADLAADLARNSTEEQRRRLRLLQEFDPNLCSAVLTALGEHWAAAAAPPCGPESPGDPRASLEELVKVVVWHAVRQLPVGELLAHLLRADTLTRNLVRRHYYRELAQALLLQSSTPSGGVDGKYGRITAEKKQFHPGEPLFVLRSTDPEAPATVGHDYAIRCQAVGCSAEHVAAARGFAERMRAWQKQHPELVKVRPD